MKMETLFKVTIAVTAKYDSLPRAINGEHPEQRTTVEHFYIANTTATGAISRAMAQVSETTKSVDPWDHREYSGKVVKKELGAVIPCNALPIGVEVTDAGGAQARFEVPA